MNHNEKQMLTVKEVAATLGLGVTTIWRQVKIGNLPKPVRIGGATRWRKSEIDAILKPEQADAALREEADLAHGLAEDGYAA